MEDWGEEIFAEGVGVKWKNEPVKYLITIQDGGIKSLIYLAFRSKITAALQAKESGTLVSHPVSREDCIGWHHSHTTPSGIH